MTRYLASKDHSLTIYFYDELISPQGSPQKSSPSKIQAASAKESNSASKTSQSSGISNFCKQRDNFACKLCGYVGSSTTLETAHLYEREEFSSVNDTEGFKMLASFDIGDIEEARNKLTMCKDCHKHFDQHMVGMKPPGVWIVTEELQQLKTTGGQLFGAFVDQKIEFSSYVSKSLLIHRHQRFLAKRAAATEESELAKNRLQYISINSQDTVKKNEFTLVTRKKKKDKLKKGSK